MAIPLVICNSLGSPAHRPEAVSRATSSVGRNRLAGRDVHASGCRDSPESCRPAPASALHGHRADPSGDRSDARKQAGGRHSAAFALAVRAPHHGGVRNFVLLLPCSCPERPLLHVAARAFFASTEIFQPACGHPPAQLDLRTSYPNLAPRTRNPHLLLPVPLDVVRVAGSDRPSLPFLASLPLWPETR